MRKILSILLTVSMLLGISATAFAAERTITYTNHRGTYHFILTEEVYAMPYDELIDLFNDVVDSSERLVQEKRDNPEFQIK